MKKAFFIITRTNEMHKYIESFTCLNGNQAKAHTFEHRQIGGQPSVQHLDSEIIAAAKEYAPDLVVYVGACSGRMPSNKTFSQLRDIAPTISLVSDASDKPWWDKVRDFDRDKCFTLQVAIDGGGEWPEADNHINALTPLDPKYFSHPIKPHAERGCFFGFFGNPGVPKKYAPRGRSLFLGDMQHKLGLKFRERAKPLGNPELDADTYSDAAKFMCDTKIMPNFSWTGSYERHHVKGRVVEAGWAGCLLLEWKESPLKKWFEPGEDFLEFEDLGQAEQILSRFKNKPDESQAFGERLRNKVQENHSPEKFWGRILERL